MCVFWKTKRLFCNKKSEFKVDIEVFLCTEIIVYFLNMVGTWLSPDSWLFLAGDEDFLLAGILFGTG